MQLSQYVRYSSSGWYFKHHYTAEVLLLNAMLRLSSASLQKKAHASHQAGVKVMPGPIPVITRVNFSSGLSEIAFKRHVN